MVAASAARTRPRSSAIHVCGSSAPSEPRERYRGHDGERFGVDIGLQEAVEKDEGVGAGLVQSQREIPNRAEVRAELDRDRDGDRVLDALKDVDVALLDFGPGVVGSPGR